jgi:hypothetical protein
MIFATLLGLYLIGIGVAFVVCFDRDEIPEAAIISLLWPLAAVGGVVTGILAIAIDGVRSLGRSDDDEKEPNDGG